MSFTLGENKVDAERRYVDCFEWVEMQCKAFLCIALLPILYLDVHKTQVIPGMEKAVLNMQIGERKTAHLQPPEAFGDISPELIVYIPAAKIPPAVLADIQIGKIISLTEEAQGEVIAVTPKGRSVSRCTSLNSNLSIMMGRERKREKVRASVCAGLTVDLNHALAGETIIFELDVVSIHRD